MIIRDKHFKFDDRCFTHRGVIIDIGCLTWDWSSYFIGKGKNVIGFDCNEMEQPVGAELRKQMVLPYSGKCFIYGDLGAASAMNICDKNNETKYEVVSLDSVLLEFTIMPSLIKMNIEGSEYPLLFSLKAPPSDQLIVSFHDWDNFPYPKKLSEVVRDYLSVWYEWRLTSKAYSWWMGLLREEFRTIT